MKPPEEIRAEFTREWLRKAEIDFKTAQHLSKSGPDFTEGTAFHSQQAAEKYLKAFLVWHQIEFQKTHDIKALLGLAGRVDENIPQKLQNSVMLTPYGVEYRYPGDYPEVSEGDAQKALSLAESVRKEIRGHLPDHLLG